MGTWGVGTYPPLSRNLSSSSSSHPSIYQTLPPFPSAQTYVKVNISYSNFSPPPPPPVSESRTPLVLTFTAKLTLQANLVSSHI